MEDHYAELRRLKDLRARSARTTEWLDEMIAREEDAIANMSALERRAWIKRVNRGAVWAGTVAAAGALRDAAVNHTGATASAGVVALAIGAGATALAIGIGRDQPPPVAGQQPSISVPVAPPTAGPTTRPPEPRRPRPTRPPLAEPPPIQAVPIIGPAPGLQAPPKARPARSMPMLPAAPGGMDGPSAAVDSAPSCLADIQLLDLNVRLVCR